MNKEQRHLACLRFKNGCDWGDCDTCPHEDCIADEEKILENKKKHRKYCREYKKRKRAWCRENGICSKCMKRPVVSGAKMCDKCHKNATRSAMTRYHYSTKEERNECRFCNKPAVSGKRTCEYHLEIYRQRAIKAAEISREKRHEKFKNLLTSEQQKGIL